MLTWVLGYLLIGFFIYWLSSAVFGVDQDVPLIWQLAAISLWPLVVIATGYHTVTRHPIDEIAMEAALHRHDAPPTQPSTDDARKFRTHRSIARSAR